MLIPLFVLALGSVAAGFLGSKIFHMVSAEGNFFEGAIFVAEGKISLLEEIHHSPLLVQFSPLIVGVIAIILAYVFYIKRTYLPQKIAAKFPLAYKISLNKWYFDEAYEAALVKPIKRLGDFLWRVIDIKFVDGIPNSAAAFCRVMAARISKIQTGYIYHYCLWMVLGVIAMVSFLISSIKQLILF